jgi:hypothetical protein
MSIPETEIIDSCDTARCRAGRCGVVGERVSSKLKSASEAARFKDWVSCWELSSLSSGITECIEGDSRKMSFASESGGLAADTIAVAGLDLAVSDIGEEVLRMVDKLGGFRLCDVRF